MGAGTTGKTIPGSQYGRVFEIPKTPGTKAVAAEICDAATGDYEVTLRESDSGSQYRLSVRVDDGRNSNAGNVNWDSYYVSEGRRCRFAMRIRFENDDALLYWLTASGATTETPPCLEATAPGKNSQR
ncbi:MAG TPA: hypothetical protein VF135_04690 [Terriglobales bacterium]